MLKWLRSSARRRASIARLLAVVLPVAWAGPLVHAADDHDVDAAAVLAMHDCREHGAEIAPVDEHELPPGVHCAACHFGRHARSAAGSAHGGFRLAVVSARLRHEPSRIPSGACSLPLPARAPPSPLA